MSLSVFLPSAEHISKRLPHTALCQGGYCDPGSLKRFLTIGLLLVSRPAGGGVTNKVFWFDEEMFPWIQALAFCKNEGSYNNDYFRGKVMPDRDIIADCEKIITFDKIFKSQYIWHIIVIFLSGTHFQILLLFCNVKGTFGSEGSDGCIVFFCPKKAKTKLSLLLQTSWILLDMITGFIISTTDVFLSYRLLAPTSLTSFAAPLFCQVWSETHSYGNQSILLS